MMDEFPFRIMAWLAGLGMLTVFAGFCWLIFHFISAVLEYVF